MGPWIVKMKGVGGKVTPIHKDIWQAAVDDANEFRAKGLKAWIEDVDGRELDETTGQPKPEQA